MTVAPRITAPSVSTVGFIGLGHMGSALAANLVAAGHDLVAYDVAGPAGCPPGGRPVEAVAAVARAASTVVLSLPDGAASQAVAREMARTVDRITTHVVDTSTIGVAAAEVVATILSEAGVSYVDAPVSGGVAGARARTLMVMFAGPDEACAQVEPVLAGLSDRRRRVGDRPGLAQALKLANNFLSATALAATSEAVAFGVSAGLDMATMLEVLDAGSGHNTATSDKFPTHVVTGRYEAGFTNSLMTKDVRLYLQEVEALGHPAAVGQATAEVWARFDQAQPGVDFTRIYPFVAGGKGGPPEAPSAPAG